MRPRPNCKSNSWPLACRSDALPVAPRHRWCSKIPVSVVRDFVVCGRPILSSHLPNIKKSKSHLTRKALTRGRTDHFSNIFHQLWPWTLTYDLGLRTRARQCTDEPANQIPRSKSVVQSCPHTHPTGRSTWTTKMIGKYAKMQHLTCCTILYRTTCEL